jgi:hypothetical protein
MESAGANSNQRARPSAEVAAAADLSLAQLQQVVAGTVPLQQWQIDALTQRMRIATKAAEIVPTSSWPSGETRGPGPGSWWYDHDPDDYPQKITFGEMRASGVRDVLIYCRDHRCSHHVAISADRWPDHVRLSDIEPTFTCTVCGHRGAEVRPKFSSARICAG